jgi:hypothetical protein
MRRANNTEQIIKENLSFTASAAMHNRILNDVLAAQEQAKKTKSGLAQANLWRTIMKSPITKIAAVITVVCALIGSLWLLDRGTGVAFGQVIENVTKAESVSFLFKQKIGDQPVFVSKVYIQHKKVRLDILGAQGQQQSVEQLQKEMQRRNLTSLLSMIGDFTHKYALELDHFRRTYKKTELDDRTVAEFTKANLIEQFRNAKEENAEWVSQEMQDGRVIDVYVIRDVKLMGIEAELSGQEGSRMKVWVERKSGLPVRILLEASFDVEGKSKDWLEFYDFAWNEPVDEDLFNLEAPEGYYTYTLAEPPVPD